MNKIWLAGAQMLLVAILTGLLLANTHPSDLPPAQSRPIQLFEQAHSLSTGLSAPDRPFALGTLLDSSLRIVSDDKYRTWCLEMFDQSHYIRDGWDRVAQEKNALISLSYVAPLEALHKYKDIEEPQPQQDGTFPEDAASDGLFFVFQNVWTSLPSTDAARLQILPELKAEAATRLAKHGEYPYAGMTFIIGELAGIETDESKRQAAEIFRDAVNSYRRGSHQFENRNDEFAKLLVKFRPAAPKHQTAIPKELFAQGVEALVDQILETPKDQSLDFESDIKTPDKSIVHFTDERDALIFKMFPMILKFAPDRAAELKRSRPELAKAAEPMEEATGGYVRRSDDARALQEIHDTIRQREKVKQIAKIQETDLDQALVLAAGLKNEAIHIQGYSALLPALMKFNEEKARQLYYGECTRLQELKSADDHLKAVVALAKASKVIDDDISFSQMTKLTFKEGLVLFEGDSRLRPEWPVSGRRGYRDLKALVEFATKHNRNLIDGQIEQLDNISLKSNLLSIEAKALHDAEPNRTGVK